MDEPASAVTPLDLSDRRLAASAAHDRIRSLILSGRLPSGTVISQVDLAAEMGISRTPLREALRMLEEEGLIEAEPNRRSRVAAFSAAEMDAIYGIRLLLEALGMRLTLVGLPPAAIEQAGLLLDELEELGGPAAGEAWHRVHHAFHETFVAGAPDPLFDQIVSYAQRSERYMYQEAHAGPALSRGRPAEHRQILQLVQARDYDAAVITAARHLARTPMLILAELAADTEPVTIRGALSMISSMGATPGRAEERAERKPRRTTA